MLVAFTLATAVLAALTALPLLRHEGWWVRGLDFPRLQLIFVLLALVLLEAALLDAAQPVTWVLLAVGAACLLYQAWWILPYTPLFPKEVKPASGAARARTLRLMIANVKTGNHEAEALLAQVRAHVPDILVTLESDGWWQERLDALESAYPHAIKCPLDNRYGMHVYSQLPLEDSRVAFLVEADKPSMHALVRLRSDDHVRMHVLHPAPPSPTENPASSERDAELVVVGRSVAQAGAGPAIVTGDLNDVAWSRTTRLFRKISGLLDPRVGRGMYNTFHARYWFMRWPLDHLFVSRHFTLCRLQRLGYFGSDHFPIFAELAFEEAGAGRRGLEPDAADQAAARAKVQDESVDASDVPRPGGAQASARGRRQR